jgi:hypothetical protein
MATDSLIRTAWAALAAVLVLASLPAEAQWKWKDKGGRIQYSDLPPPAETADADILSRPSAQRRAANVGVAPAAAASVAPGASAPTLASARPPAPKPDAEFDAKLKKGEAEAAAKKKADEERMAAARADNCQRAREQLRTYDSGVRVFRVNEKGEREYVDDKQRADQTRQARDVVAADCPK